MLARSDVGNDPRRRWERAVSGPVEEVRVRAEVPELSVLLHGTEPGERDLGRGGVTTIPVGHRERCSGQKAPDPLLHFPSPRGPIV